MGSSLPVVDLGNNSAKEVAAGQSHTCVLLTSGNVTCFGYNYYGQVRTGEKTAYAFFFFSLRFLDFSCETTS